jgi:DNA-binding response OmpR family regulator
MKILLIDDDKLLRRAIERTLAKAGYDLICCGDGEEGVRLAAETSPDLILLDMMLPKLPGVNVLRQLKQITSTKDIPVIVLSGLSQNNAAKLLKEGAAKYMEKTEKIFQKDSALFLAIEDLLHGATGTQSALSASTS